MGDSEPTWSYLPDIVLERVLSLLPPRYLARTSQVCENWNRIFYSNRPWETFVYHDDSFTRSNFTLHTGFQRFLDYNKVRYLIKNTTRKWRCLVFMPLTVHDYLHNVYEFIRALTNYAQYYANQDEAVLGDMRWLEFNWRLCFHEDPARPRVYGTGGPVLQSLKVLLSHMHGLQYLALRQLQLADKEADEFITYMLELFGSTLRRLCIRNLTKGPTSFLHLGLFLRLTKLIVSPQHLNDDVVVLLGGSLTLMHLVLIQDESTIGAAPVSECAWKEFRKAAYPQCAVHLKITGRCSDDMVWQPSAPVASIAYDTPFARLTVPDALTIVDNYADTLTAYAQHGLQRRYRRREFDARCDCAAVVLARDCQRLRVLAIRERLSNATVLYLASLVANRPDQQQEPAFWLCVRRNALLKRRDWPRSPDWSRQFWVWMRRAARDYSLTEVETAKVLRKTSWTALTDNQYIHLFPTFKM